MLLWTNDIHLNFLKQDDGALRFAQYLMEENPTADGLIIAGDISDGNLLETHLTQLAQGFPKPIYLTTGNHDYYHSSFAKIDELVTGLTKKFDNLHWLNQGNHTYEGISIVGVGGWYDSRQGNCRTRVELSDFTAIEDLWGGLNCRDLMIDLVRKRAAKEAERLDELLFQEMVDVDEDVVLVATHISPYPESCWHKGKQSDREWLPWFCSHVTGEVLDKYAESFPGKKFVVLVGHGHSPGIYERRDNLIVYTGGAIYGYPDVAGTIDVVCGKIVCYNSFGKKVERTFP
ncbi:metallophosphoesterase [Candidatus Pacearchaeota archaeon]|jgi:predicted phosphohydrolase|nr:metallophosphoesterase [Candidatus Pacearchaeota archaeon]